MKSEIMKMSFINPDKNFTRVPNCLIDEFIEKFKLTPLAILVWIHLNSKQHDFDFNSRNIGKVLKFQKTAINRAINLLIISGLLQRIEVARYEYKYHLLACEEMNHFKPSDPPEGQGFEPSDPPEGHSSPNCGSSDPSEGQASDPPEGRTNKTKENNTKINNKSIPLSGTCLTFQQFYDMYDWKKDGPKAKATFAKTSEAERELIKAHVPLYVASTEKKYRKHPHRYLEQQGWLNEITKITEKPDSTNNPSKTYSTQSDADKRQQHMMDEIDSCFP